MTRPRKKKPLNKAVGHRRKMAFIQKALNADRQIAKLNTKVHGLEEKAYDFRKQARAIAEKYEIGL